MRFIAYIVSICALGFAPVTNGFDIEPNNDFATATAVKLPMVNGMGCLDSADDVDYYGFTLAEPTPLFVSARAKDGSQFKLTLYDAKHRMVHKSTDILDLSDVNSGAYFVRVSGVTKDCYDFEIFAETRMPPFG